MNRDIVVLGVVSLVSGIALLLAPYYLPESPLSAEMLPVGSVVIPVALIVLLLGASSPDPRITTVKGVFGNPDENLLAQRGGPRAPGPDPRYLPHPKESVHCRHCYTLISPEELRCPRCARRRECRICDKPLFLLAGAVRCAPCVRSDVYCNCPRTKRSKGGALISRSSRW